MTHQRLAGAAIAFSFCTFLSGCGRVEQTLPPLHADRVGTRTQFVTDRFGVCWPGEFDRTVVADPVAPAGEGEFTAGFANHIRPGQTCNTQESFSYAGLIHFDQAQLQGKIIMSAHLRIDRRNTNLPIRVDRVVPSGVIHDAGCQVSVRLATEDDWAAGRAGGVAPSEPLPGRHGGEAALEQQTSIIGAGIGVRDIVQQWALGRRPNRGFVIMAKPGAIAKNENSCTGFWSNARLELTVLDFPAP